MKITATKDMGAIRAAADRRIAQAAAAERARYSTPGKDGLYLAKLDEAARYEDAGMPADLGGFPFIAAEVGVTAETPAQLVTLWQNLSLLWLGHFGPAIEGREQRAKAAIAAADTPAQVAAVSL
jgi:hypothetical protein